MDNSTLNHFQSRQLYDQRIHAAERERLAREAAGPVAMRRGQGMGRYFPQLRLVLEIVRKVALRLSLTPTR